MRTTQNDGLRSYCAVREAVRLSNLHARSLQFQQLEYIVNAHYNNRDMQATARNRRRCERELTRHQIKW